MNNKIIAGKPPTRAIDPDKLLELVNTYVWLDPEHQKRAVNALLSILNDQITEGKSITKAI